MLAEARRQRQTLCYTSVSRTQSVDLKVEVRSILKKRSRLSLAVAAFFAVAVAFTVLGCGKNFYFAARNLPPSGVVNRVLVAVDNPVGSLQFMDAYYDIRHPFNNPNGQFSISGYTGQNPVTIQNLPEEQSGLIYASGDGTFTSLDYSAEKVNKPIVCLWTHRGQHLRLAQAGLHCRRGSKRPRHGGRRCSRGNLPDERAEHFAHLHEFECDARPGFCAEQQ